MWWRHLGGKSYLLWVNYSYHSCITFLSQCYVVLDSSVSFTDSLLPCSSIYIHDTTIVELITSINQSFHTICSKFSLCFVCMSFINLFYRKSLKKSILSKNNLKQPILKNGKEIRRQVIHCKMPCHARCDSVGWYKSLMRTVQKLRIASRKFHSNLRK